MAAAYLEYVSKEALVKLHQDLTAFETLVMKRSNERRESGRDVLESISFVQGAIERIVAEYPHETTG